MAAISPCARRWHRCKRHFKRWWHRWTAGIVGVVYAVTNVENFVHVWITYVWPLILWLVIAAHIVHP